ncbi:MAG: hypothetical protein HY075_10965 [Deltaproteobacteria bacterium]|nr:hypothetical protein [Deltaproteobacteria bacterium]
MGVRRFAAVFAVLAFAFSTTSQANDGGTAEGRFVNATNRILYCFRDIGEDDDPGQRICSTPLAPGQACAADAISLAPSDAPIFKIPNRVTYRCAINEQLRLECSADTLLSGAIMRAAKLAKASGTYGDMSWVDFRKRMVIDGLSACTDSTTVTTLPAVSICELSLPADAFTEVLKQTDTVADVAAKVTVDPAMVPDGPEAVSVPPSTKK